MECCSSRRGLHPPVPSPGLECPSHSIFSLEEQKSPLYLLFSSQANLRHLHLMSASGIHGPNFLRSSLTYPSWQVSLGPYLFHCPCQLPKLLLYRFTGAHSLRLDGFLGSRNCLFLSGHNSELGHPSTGPQEHFHGC